MKISVLTCQRLSIIQEMQDFSAILDFVIFDGLFSKGKISEVILAEVKSGYAALNDIEKSIKRAIDKGKVNFELMRIK